MSDESTVPFDDLRPRLDELVARYPQRAAAMLPVLWVVQDARGWLSPESIAEVAAYLEVPQAHVEGVITFYTAGDTESHAWIVPRDTSAAKAAGTIHSDIERGFIRAEVVPYDVLVREGAWNACRDKGLLRLEGKDYPIHEADVVYFRFNV